MSTGYTTYQQHEPLRAPAGWSVQEKRFVAQLEELFDDIYKRYNRLRLEDMSPAFRKSFKQIMDDGAELRTDLDITAAGLSAEITRASTAEGNLSTAITQSATTIMSTVSSTYLSKTDASDTYAKKSEIVQDDTSWKTTFQRIGASGYTASGITTITENGITVTHSSLSNCKTEMSASGFRILNSSNTVIGGVMSLNNQIVTAMQCLYNPSYPTFRLEVGRFSNPVSGGTTTIDGIGFIYNNARRLGIGMEYDSVTGNIVGEKIISTDNYGVIADNKTINMFNGFTGLSLYPTSGSAYGDIQLYHATNNVGVFVTDSDVLVKFMRYGRLVTVRASNYFQPDD